MEKQRPQRSCIGCRQVKDKESLTRVVRREDGSIRLDLSGKARGRGAYLCPGRDCLEQAIKKGGFARSFKQVLSPEDKALLIEAMSELGKKDPEFVRSE